MTASPPLKRHTKTQLIIVSEAVLEAKLLRDAQALGAQSWTVTEVRAASREGVREGAWEADRTVELKLVCEPKVADAIAEHVLAQYAGHYNLSITLSSVWVLRPERY
jgi:hypothetical protein